MDIMDSARKLPNHGFDAYFTPPASGDVAYLCTAAEVLVSPIRFDSAAVILRPDPVVLAAAVC